MKASLNYESALNELKQITEEIESEQVSVDVLAAKVKRAAVLSEFCLSKLRDTEVEVNNIIKGMDSLVSREK